MITLEYFNGKTWNPCGLFHTEEFAWLSLGGDEHNYRTVNASGEVLTDKTGKIPRKGSPGPIGKKGDPKTKPLPLSKEQEAMIQAHVRLYRYK